MSVSLFSEADDNDFQLGSESGTIVQDFHAHEDYEVLYFQSGQVQYYLEERSYSLVPGDVLIIPPAVMHRPVVIEEKAVYSRMVMMLSVAYCRRLMQRLPESFVWKDTGPFRIHLNPQENEDFVRSMERLLHLEQSPEGLLERDSLCTLLLLQFQSRIGQSQPDELESPGQIQQILQYINAHYTEPLNLEDIAEQFYLSKSHLLRQFKAYTKSTVYNYILAKRVLLAKALLKDKMPPGRVCTACGFGSYVSFYQAFYKSTGMSPSQYGKDGRA